MVVNNGLLGDLFIIIPFLNKLKELYPRYKICLLTSEWAKGAISDSSNLDEIYYLNTFWANPENSHSHKISITNILSILSLVKKIRKHKYDLIINTWFYEQILTVLFLRLLNFKNLIGFDFQYSKKFYDYSIAFNDNLTYVQNTLNFIKTLDPSVTTAILNSNIKWHLFDPNIKCNYGIIPDKLDLDNKYIVLSPFSKDLTKNWDIENWIKLIQDLFLSSKFDQIVITGTKEFVKISKTIEEKVPDIINLVGKLTFIDFICLLRKSNLLISLDSGSVHVANAYGVPVFILFNMVYNNYKNLLPLNSIYDYEIVDVDCKGCLYGCAQPKCTQYDYEKVKYKILSLIYNIM